MSYALNLCIKQEDLDHANSEILRRKELRKEQERAEEEKVLEFQRQKAVSLHFFQHVKKTLNRSI